MISNLKNLEYLVVLRLSLFFVPLQLIAILSVISSLYGISNSIVFSIVFCVILFAFAGLFSYMAYKSDHSKSFRILSICITVFMFISSACCIIVNENVLNIKSELLKGLYVFIAASIISNFSFIISIICSFTKCMGISERLLSTERVVQIYIVVNFILGMVVGGIFGFANFEGISKTGLIVLIVFLALLTTTVSLAFVVFNEYSNEYMNEVQHSPLIETSLITGRYNANREV